MKPCNLLLSHDCIQHSINMKHKIKAGDQFRDNHGSLLQVVSAAKDDDWWCKGVPDTIGQWLYNSKTIRQGKNNL